ncbi:hypothetical protein vseg_016171 [Gypsophila vaccaria]
MSFNYKKTAVSELQIGNRNVEVGVRVLKKWRTFYDLKEKWIRGLEMLLMDEKSTIIQASVPKQLLTRFDQSIIEGKMYNISRFVVTPNSNPDHKATTANIKIDIGYSTIVTEALNLHIPKYGFKFTPIEDIVNEHVNENTYIDVIAELAQCNPTKQSQKGNFWTTIDIEDLQ